VSSWHGIVLNSLSTGTKLPLFKTVKGWCLSFDWMKMVT
jgi:hypothetical protein